MSTVALHGSEGGTMRALAMAVAAVVGLAGLPGFHPGWSEARALDAPVTVGPGNEHRFPAGYARVTVRNPGPDQRINGKVEVHFANGNRVGKRLANGRSFTETVPDRGSFVVKNVGRSFLVVTVAR